jgi:hypothetical protein
MTTSSGSWVALQLSEPCTKPTRLSRACFIASVTRTPDLRQNEAC